MADTVYNAIKDICGGKETRNIFPAAATYTEIVLRLNVPHDDIKEAIRQLCREKRITWHRTINGFSFETND